MALTTTQETKIKTMIAKEDKQIQINNINKIAYDAIHIKKDEIQVIENKRIIDIKALNG